MNQNNNHFFDGFVLGLIVGGMAVFLLGTKSGKKILRRISEEGLEGFEDLLENYQSDEQEFEEEPTKNVTNVEEVETEDVKLETPEKVEVSPKKKFFKRFKRVD